MKVGFIGVGFMGRHMARNVAKGGHDLTVFDIHKEAAEELISMGATWADSPRSVGPSAGSVLAAGVLPVHAASTGTSRPINRMAKDLLNICLTCAFRCSFRLGV